MALEPVITSLRAKLAAISTGTEKKYLDSFKTIHNKWHMDEMNTGTGTFGGAAIGFLSFHHEVLSVYVARFKPGLVPGPMGQPLPPYRPAIDNAPDARRFSSDVEGWHNLVHRNVAKYGADFADPKKNIYLPRFWQFHAFIDQKLQGWLGAHGQAYDALDHTLV